MAYCSLCGKLYIISSGRKVTKPVVAQGARIQTEFPIGKCPDCREPGEEVNLVLVGDDDLFGTHGS